ncbi:MAG: universal stress protein [Nitrospira sp.]
MEVPHNSHVAFLVMATHRMTGSDRLRLGSVAESILRQAPCPVLTVRASAPIPLASSGSSMCCRRRVKWWP